MIYCKKCARLLDEDVRYCPYCDSEDEHFMPDATDVPNTTDVPNVTDVPNATDVPNVTDVPIATEATDVLLRQLDEHIARNENTSDILPPDNATLSTSESVPSTGEPAPNTAGPALSAFESVPYTADVSPSTGRYVGMILLSVCLPLPGLIIGIVYMTNKSSAYRKMGLTMLLVSIGATLLWCVACCALFYVIGSTMTAITTY